MQAVVRFGQAYTQMLSKFVLSDFRPSSPNFKTR